jgi:spore coat protein CotF
MLRSWYRDINKSCSQPKLATILIATSRQMSPALSRVKREQLRKRLNNLLRRHNEFWLLYRMKSWLIMELPDGQIFTYHSHPDTPPPSREDMVRLY